MANTNDELAALSRFFKPQLLSNSTVLLQNWPEKPTKQTLVIRSLPDETSVIATGLTRTTRSFQVLYVDDRIDKALALVDKLKLELAGVITIPVDAETFAFMRVNEILGGKPFKTEGSAPLDGASFTIRTTSHVARSSEVYETMQQASIGFS